MDNNSTIKIHFRRTKTGDILATLALVTAYDVTFHRTTLPAATPVFEIFEQIATDALKSIRKRRAGLPAPRVVSMQMALPTS